MLGASLCRVHWIWTDLHRLPSVVDITTAGKALGLSRTRAYELAKRGEFPCRVIRIGETYRVPTPELLKLLGIEPARPGASAPIPEPRSAHRWTPSHDRPR